MRVKNLLLAAISLLMAIGCILPAQARGKFVTIQGTDLIAPDGSKLYIQGTNLGNWLNPEGYMFGFKKTNSARLINEMLCELVGPDAAAEFWKTFKDNYVTEADIEFLHAQGVNTIRIPFNYRLFTNEDYMGLTSDQDGFERIDEVIGWCRSRDIYVVLDMHDAPGGQTGDNIDDSYGYPWLFESAASQQKFCEIWKKIAKHYKNETAVIGYELLNEPIAPYFKNKDDLNALLEPVCKMAVKAIREVDENHIIIMGAPQWNSNFEVLKDWKFDDKLIYTCHRYGGDVNEQSLRNFFEFQEKTGLPMFMGETGHNSYEWQRQMVEILKKHNIGYLFWPYKMMRKGGMVSVPAPDGWEKIVRFSEADRSSFKAIREARPDQDSSKVILREYLESCLFSNCKPDMEYIESLELKGQVAK
jgi:endoglucanase